MIKIIDVNCFLSNNEFTVFDNLIKFREVSNWSKQLVSTSKLSAYYRPSVCFYKKYNKPSGETKNLIFCRWRDAKS